MTVCIAAICEGGAKIVVAADRMFTASPPVNLEFETAEKKIEALASGCVALIAGATALATEILQEGRRNLAGSQDPPVSHVVDVLKDSYVAVRSTKIREQILLPHLGPDFLKVERVGTTLPLYLQSQPNLYGQLVMLMNGYNLNTDIIVAGIDSAARIAIVTHPGTVFWLDKLGYAATGSGAIHATMRLALGAQTRNAALVETLYRVYEAKRASEVAPGVGLATDVAIIEKGNVSHCNDKVLGNLKDVFDTSQKGFPNLDSIKRAIEVTS